MLTLQIAPVAQWIEHPPPKGRVTRSIRVGGTKWLGEDMRLSALFCLPID